MQRSFWSIRASVLTEFYVRFRSVPALLSLSDSFRQLGCASTLLGGQARHQFEVTIRQFERGISPNFRNFGQLEQ